MNNFNNPLSNMDPISQTKELYENLQELNENIIKILQTISPFIKDSLSIPCQISTKINESICSISKNIHKNFDNISTENLLLSIQNISKNSFENMDQIKKLYYPDLQKSLNIKNNLSISNQEQDIKKSNNKLSKNLKGGSINNTYEYIINPINGKNINIYTKSGRKIIKNYIKYGYNINYIDN